MNNNSLIWKYAGLAMQFLVGIAIALYGGYKIDQFINTGTPLAIWILPLLVIIFIIYKIIKDTQPKN